MYLLDTHVLLWWWTDDRSLSETAKEVIIRNPVYVSTAAIWEMCIKKKLGKLQAPDNLAQLILDEGFSILDIKANHVETLNRLADHHQDPFDRIQIAQALSEDLIFITKDEKILQYREINVLHASRNTLNG